MKRNAATPLVALSLLLLCLSMARASPERGLRLGRFSADVTVPVGHRLMGVLPVKAKRVVDPLYARGFVLLGAGKPILLVAVDWCEIRNDAYERWREVLAGVAGTSRERVIVASVHQHDAPVADLGAERLLAQVGLGGELCDVAFHEEAVQRVARALSEGLEQTRRITHVGIGRARVERIASNRRVTLRDGRVTFGRGSASGGNPVLREAPDGLIDPWLRTISFWEGTIPLVALHSYASHPMSYYGRGGVSADFVGMARRRLEEENPAVLQIYTSGPSGDVTAGKYNDGAPENRPVLADRLYRAMKSAWESTRREPVRDLRCRSTQLSLEFRRGNAFTSDALEETLNDPEAAVRDRILAAMGLSSRQRIARGQAIDVPCVDLGIAQIVLFPGESFVGYQLMAKRLRTGSFVLCIGYGECWPGYVPTRRAFADGFGDTWNWVAPGAEARVRAALWRVLPGEPPEHDDPGVEEAVRDVYPATDSYPRYSEGSILRRTDGSLLFATTEFSGGGADHSSARIVARISSDGGKTWGTKRVMQKNIGRMNVMSVSLRLLESSGSSTIGMFFLVKNGMNDLKVFLRTSTDDGKSFGHPVLVTDAPGYHVMNNDRVIQLLSGRLICPVAWTRDVRRENHFVSFCYFSDDGGDTWRAGKGRVDLPKRGAMEPEVVELKCGSLLMILRTQLGEIYVSHSNDGGDTWSPASPWGVASPESPATLRRIPSTGDLLLVWNPIHVEGAGHGGPRTPLVAAVSRDEGRTWENRRMLESATDRTYAYTSLTFVDEHALLSYYVRDEASGRISSRFRSIPIGWFYRTPRSDRTDDACER